jgi:hypothetical protein
LESFGLKASCSVITSAIVRILPIEKQKGRAKPGL